MEGGGGMQKYTEERGGDRGRGREGDYFLFLCCCILIQTVLQ